MFGFCILQSVEVLGVYGDQYFREEIQVYFGQGKYRSGFFWILQDVLDVEFRIWFIFRFLGGCGWVEGVVEEVTIFDIFQSCRFRLQSRLLGLGWLRNFFKFIQVIGKFIYFKYLLCRVCVYVSGVFVFSIRVRVRRSGIR